MEENRTVEICESEDGQVHIDVQIIEDNVWINRIQMSELFGRDIKTIGKHIKNSLSEELAGEATVANFATVQNRRKPPGKEKHRVLHPGYDSPCWVSG